jgi:hypothetical protein
MTFFKTSPLTPAAIIIAIIVVLAYGDALRLPFFYDDLQHLVWLRDQTPLSIFFGEAGRTYYRPMQFLAWKLYETIFGRDSALVYHSLNLILHAFNALLVVVLARRLADRPRRWWPAILAGIIFALFPFAYQVVPLPASLTHPIATLFVLLAILSYDRFQISARRRWLFVALGCSLIALTSNEGSILVGSLIALFVFMRPRSERRWREVVLFIALAGGYYLWYQAQQADNSGMTAVRNLETLIQNSAYMLEGLSLPLQPIGTWLMGFGLSDLAAAFSVAALALTGSAILLWRVQRLRRFIFGIGWYGLCVTPAIVLLSNNYLINAPRLMYLASVGMAWMWASTVEAIWDQPGLLRIRRAAAVALAAGILISAFIFVRQHMAMYLLTTAPLQTAIDVADRSQPTERLLFVNLPAWLGPAKGWYPIGHEGVLLLQKTISMDDLLTANLGRTLPTQAMEFDNLSSPQAYYYGIYGPSLDWDPLKAKVREADQVYLTVYFPQTIDLIKAGGLQKASSAPEKNVATFGESLTLENAAWEMCGQQLRTTLDWFAPHAAPADLHIFVHLLNPDGTLAAQHDSPPLLGLHPFWQWSQGDQVEDVHPIDVSQLPRDRAYTLAVGLYDPSNGQRLLPITGAGEQPSDRAVRLGQFSLDQVKAACD